MDLKINQKTKKLVILGVLLAIGVILDITPLGAIPMPGGVSATITMVPVIIGGVILGPVYGLYLGISMGVVSLLHALMRPVTLLDPLFVNPLLSVLPRAMIGVVSGFVYIGMKKILKNTAVSLIVGGIAGSLTNTVLVLSMMYLLYAKVIQETLDLADKKALRYVLYGIIAGNGIMEAIVAAVITCGIGLALKKGLPKGSTQI